MTATWKQYEGQAVDGIPLLRLLGGSELSAVFLAERAGERCAMKLVPTDEAVAQIPLARWQQASKLSHPHLTRIHQWGRAHLGDLSLVYLAMEFAEEDLAEVDRPLAPQEAREMLAPTAKALAYLHSQKFAHGRVEPSNILSVNDVLKISGDAPLRLGERHAAPPTPYDPPELASSGVTAAGDVWSLGVTLVEALTKEFPACEADPPRLPDALRPNSFREVVAGCLRHDPARRWTVADIEQWLERGTVPAPKSAKRRYILPTAVAAGVVVAGAVAWPHLTGSQTAGSQTNGSQPASSQTSDRSVAPAAASVAPVVTLPQKPAEPQQPASAPTSVRATPSRRAARRSSAKTRTTAAVHESAQQQDAPPPPPTVLSPDVVRPVIPDVPAKARTTIHGKVPIVVRVEADTDGTVINAKVESGGSSKYFAEMALQAARQWKFAPGDGARAWALHFEFTRNAEHPVSAQVTPAH